MERDHHCATYLVYDRDNETEDEACKIEAFDMQEAAEIRANDLFEADCEWLDGTLCVRPTWNDEEGWHIFHVTAETEMVFHAEDITEDWPKKGD